MRLLGIVIVYRAGQLFIGSFFVSRDFGAHLVQGFFLEILKTTPSLARKKKMYGAQ